MKNIHNLKDVSRKINIIFQATMATLLLLKYILFFSTRTFSLSYDDKKNEQRQSNDFLFAVMNRFLDIEIGDKNLPPIGAYWQHSLLPLKEALLPVMDRFDQLDRSIKEAKKRCCSSSKNQLTKEESAALFLYSMEGGDNSFYRILNKDLRSENRREIGLWFGFLKLFDTALSKLPTVRKCVWRGVVGSISQQFKEGATLTWWGISSCSLKLNAVQEFLGSNTNATLFMIEVKSAKDIRGYTAFPDEEEVLLRPGTELRVQSNALHRDSLHVVHLIEINSDDDYDDDAEPFSSPMKPMDLAPQPQKKGAFSPQCPLQIPLWYFVFGKNYRSDFM